MPQGDRHPASRFESTSEPSGILDAFEPLSVRNLSSEGMLIECPSPLEVGSIHEFQLIDGTTSVRVCAAVRHVSLSRQSSAERYFLVELEFLNFNTRSFAAVERWIKGKSVRSTRKRA
jgi:hypothetical protein